MKKGFTLIELLGVLIILGILALITTPVVLNTINSSKKNSMRVSVEHYIDAVEIGISGENVNGKHETLDGVYKISDEGKTLTKENIIINLDYDGVALTKGFLKIENGLVSEIINGTAGKWTAKIVDDKIELVD